MPIFDQFSSTNLGLSFIAPAQAQKHVTVNESFRVLDAVVQLSVIDKDMATPPASPAEGDRYIIASGGTGEWLGSEHKIAAFQDGAWSIITPQVGWITYVVDEANTYTFDGNSWTATPVFESLDYVSRTSTALQTMIGSIQIENSNPELVFHDIETSSTDDFSRLIHSGAIFYIQTEATNIVFQGYGGVDLEGELIVTKSGTGHTVFHQGNHATGNDNVRFGQLGVGGATADTTNILSVNGSAVLFNNAGNGIQIKLNKNAVGDTASFLFQNGFSGRAEIGLTGDDNFYFKVSPDGSTFYEAIVIDRNNGNVGIGKTTPTTKLDVDGAVRFKTYTVATLPSASSNGAGSMIYVSDETGGAVMAFSDGTDWRRVTDRVAVS